MSKNPSLLSLKKSPPIRNIKLTIEYDGTNYCGWQTQGRYLRSVCRIPSSVSRRPSIQETIEKTLQKILQEKIKLVASGRTDAGVHAQAQVANFKTKSKLTLEKIKKALNGLLPKDIVVKKIEEVDLDFHSRFWAKSKVYRYVILNRAYPSAFLKNRAYFYPYPLDLKIMKKEAKVLLGRHDFSAFAKIDKKPKNSLRTIKKIKIFKNKNLINIEIEADGFLHNMIRFIIGTLLWIGRHKFSAGTIKKIFKTKDKKLIGPVVPACGLYLVRVNY